MAFAATPLVGGDLHDAALRLALAADRDLAGILDPAAQLAALRRHWDAIAELGWAGTIIAEAHGGAGGTLADLAALAGGAGAGGLPLPLAVTAVVPTLLAAGGQALLPALATGAARIAAILPDAPRDPGMATPTLDAAGRLSGAAAGIAMPPDPTHVLVATGGADPALLLLAATDRGVACTPYLRIDTQPAGDWHFAGATPEFLARGPAVGWAVEQARDLGALMVCIEAVAAMGAILEQTIEYLSTRVQFGVPLASHQALRHRVADMHVARETLRGLVVAALRAAAAEDALPWREIAFAKLRLGEVGRFVAQEAIQCHGGMGLTEGVPAIRRARRVMMAEYEYGDSARQAARLLGQG